MTTRIPVADSATVTVDAFTCDCGSDEVEVVLETSAARFSLSLTVEESNALGWALIRAASIDT